mmetsp:Transcript_87580/g.272177  ORF Transcript_87580/g.272177 Transcript_87580/m.272177 type:complete len:233 (+) Transcript_87580:282-980(+)
MSELIMSVGPAIKDVPVSTATWQLPWHNSWRLSPMVMSCISTCQYPGFETGTQKRSPAMRAALYSPKVISLSSLSEAPKNTEKTLDLRTLSRIMQSRMLKCGPSDICGRLSPRMPSKGTRLKGSSDSSVAATKSPCVQMLPTQMSSLMKTPLISPVPKVMVTTSRSPPRSTAPSGWSAKATSTALEERDASKRLCEVHASSVHCLEGKSRFPLPVSKTTRKRCGGLPTPTWP